MQRSNLLSLGLIQIFRLLSGFALNVMVMRGLGVEGFGVYGYVNILVGLASFSATMGMDRLLKRELARDPEASGRFLATGLAASLLLSALTSGGILLWAWAMDGRAAVLQAAGLASVAVGLQALSQVPVSYFHAIQQMHLGVRGNLWGRVVLVGATGLFLWWKLGVVAVFLAQVLDGLVCLSLMWGRYRRLSVPPLSTTAIQVQEMIRTLVPFGLNSLFVSIYLNADVILLAHARSDAEVGLYRGAVMLLSLVTILSETLTTGVFPRMSRLIGQPVQAGEELRFTSQVLLALSMPLAVGGALVAGPLMVLVGGADFAGSAPLFQIMAPMLPFRFLSNGYGMTLSALDRQSERTWGALLAALFNLSLNAWAIPHYGAAGAAGSTLLTELLLFGFLYLRVGRLVEGLQLGKGLLRAGLPALLMAIAILLLPSLHVVVVVGFGALLYAGVGRLCGAWAWADLRRLRRV